MYTLVIILSCRLDAQKQDMHPGFAKSTSLDSPTFLSGSSIADRYTSGTVGNASNTYAFNPSSGNYGLETTPQSSYTSASNNSDQSSYSIILPQGNYTTEAQGSAQQAVATHAYRNVAFAGPKYR